jgi:hypothetical protein
MEIVFNPSFARQPGSDVMGRRTMVIIDAVALAGKQFVFE